MNKKNVKNFLKKFWLIVWKDNSPKGWIISVVFLFLLIYFILFPLLNLVTGTVLPLVIVESCSMYHDGGLFSDLEDWVDRHGVNYLRVGIDVNGFWDFSMKRGFNKGDILFVTGVKPEKLEEGDVIIFNANYKHPIIHRIINIEKEGEEYIFSTMGDNVGEVQFFEKRISQDQIVGKARTILIPYLGWGKLIFFEPFQDDNNKGFCKEN
ncbi:signal peptidase I [archaeon]|jgi:signal peptidase I|nr:signal peptidase I [archaeon]